MLRFYVSLRTTSNAAFPGPILLLPYSCASFGRLHWCGSNRIITHTSHLPWLQFSLYLWPTNPLQPVDVCWLASPTDPSPFPKLTAELTWGGANRHVTFCVSDPRRHRRATPPSRRARGTKTSPSRGRGDRRAREGSQVRRRGESESCGADGGSRNRAQPVRERKTWTQHQPGRCKGVVLHRNVVVPD